MRKVQRYIACGQKGRAGPGKKGRANTALTGFSQTGDESWSFKSSGFSCIGDFRCPWSVGLSKEAAKPVEKKKVDSVIEQFGFKRATISGKHKST